MKIFHVEQFHYASTSIIRLRPVPPVEFFSLKPKKFSFESQKINFFARLGVLERCQLKSSRTRDGICDKITQSSARRMAGQLHPVTHSQGKETHGNRLKADAWCCDRGREHRISSIGSANFQERSVNFCSSQQISQKEQSANWL